MRVGLSNLHREPGGEMGARDTRSERLWLTHEQEVARARWLLLAALAREYPERTASLIEAVPHYHGMLAQYGELAPAFGRVLSERVSAHVEEDVGPDGFVTSLDGHIKAKPTPLTLAIGRWAVANNLVTVQGYRYDTPEQSTPILRPAYWVTKYAVRIMEKCPVSDLEVAETCRKYAENIGIETAAEWRCKRTDLPYPEKPTLIFVPSFESKQAFLEKSLSQLEQYAEQILRWSEANGARPEKGRRVEQNHFKWLAWRLIDGLSLRAIARREADREGTATEKAYTAIKNALDKIEPLVFSEPVQFQ